jgi:hypothetical protein
VRGTAVVLVLAAVACDRDPSTPPRPSPPTVATPHVSPAPPSLGSRISAFDARLASAICDTMCRCDRMSGCMTTCATGMRGGFPTDDQVLAARGCRLDDTAVDRCLAAANAECSELRDFGEWQLYVEGECAKVVPCTTP